MTAVPIVASDLQIAAGRRRRERVVKVFFAAAAVLSIVISLAIILSLVGNALTFFLNVDKASLWTDGWFPRRGLFDIKTIVVGTLVISAVAMLVATPLGLGAGIYLSEYASPRVRRSLKPILEILASIPSVVLGFFALTWISPNVIQPLTDAPLSNMAAAGIAVGVLITPLIASVSEDAMHAVPAYLREASFGLGARRRTTTMSIVVPAAVSGIVAALIIGVSRAIGETMIVAIAAGGTGGSLFEWNPLEPGQTMTAAMTALAIGSDRVRGAEYTFESLFFVGFLLFVVTLALNLMSDAFVRRVRRAYSMAIRVQALRPSEIVEQRLRGHTTDWRSRALEMGLLLSLLISLGVLLVLLANIIITSFPVFATRPVDFLFSPLSARPATAGILQGLVGSLLLVLFVVLMALPLGVGAAVYLEEYAHDSGLTRLIRTNIRNLAGVPAIVYGLLGLAVFVTLLGMGKVLIAGGLTLAIVVLPIVVITASEALRAVPVSIREAAFGVGATRWETVRSHVLPYAAPGILTGTILALARAFGETAPLLMVGAIAGTFSNTDPGKMLSGSYTALPTIIFDWTGKPQDEFRALTAAAIVVLLVVIMLVNAIAITLRNRYDRRW